MDKAIGEFVSKYGRPTVIKLDGYRDVVDGRGGGRYELKKSETCVNVVKLNKVRTWAIEFSEGGIFRAAAHVYETDATYYVVHGTDVRRVRVMLPGEYSYSAKTRDMHYCHQAWSRGWSKLKQALEYVQAGVTTDQFEGEEPEEQGEDE